MRSSIDVHNYLQTEGVQHEIVALDSSPRTAKRLAAILGLKPCEVAKTLLFVADGEPVLVIVPGDKRADHAKIREVLGKDRAEFADPKTVLEVTDYCLGATPPVAHKQRIQCVIDLRILKHDIIYTSGGEVSMVLKMRSKDLQNVTKGQIADVCFQTIHADV